MPSNFARLQRQSYEIDSTPSFFAAYRKKFALGSPKTKVRL